MLLVDHLRELRSRLVKASLAIIAGMVVGWIYYDAIFAWLAAPFETVVNQARAEGRDITLALTGVADPFVLQLQISAVTGLLLSSPVWLYQLWRFVTPGLRRGFTPQNVENIVAVDRYLSFFIRMVLVFGVGFLAPLMLVLLNFAGILTGKKLLSWWRWIIFIVFIFSAVATPTGDPINMLLLAGPILLLMTLAILICLANDKRRARKAGTAYDEWDDDETSPLEPADQE